jgi:hypothetical protein
MVATFEHLKLGTLFYSLGVSFILRWMILNERNGAWTPRYVQCRGVEGPERHTFESIALDKQSYFNCESKLFSLRA